MDTPHRDGVFVFRLFHVLPPDGDVTRALTAPLGDDHDGLTALEVGPADDAHEMILRESGGRPV